MLAAFQVLCREPCSLDTAWYSPRLRPSSCWDNHGRQAESTTNQSSSATATAQGRAGARATVLPPIIPAAARAAPKKMTNEEFLDRQYHISVIAGMNQRYHQDRSSLFAWWDRGLKIAVGLLAVAGSVLAFSGPEWLSILIACVAAAFAIVLNVVPVGDWHCHHVELFRRWSDLREEVDAMIFGIGENPSPDLIAHLRGLDAKVHRICGAEPKGDQTLIDKFFAQEEESRRPARTLTPSQPAPQL